MFHLRLVQIVLSTARRISCTVSAGRTQVSHSLSLNDCVLRSSSPVHPLYPFLSHLHFQRVMRQFCYLTRKPHWVWEVAHLVLLSLLDIGPYPQDGVVYCSLQGRCLYLDHMLYTDHHVAQMAPLLTEDSSCQVRLCSSYLEPLVCRLHRAAFEVAGIGCSFSSSWSSQGERIGQMTQE